MKAKLAPCLLAICAWLGCNTPPADTPQNPAASSPASLLTAADRALCGQLGIDTTVVERIRSRNSKPIAAFPATPGGDMGIERQDPAFQPLAGILVKETNTNAYDLVLQLKDELRDKGYTIFLSQNNFGFGNQLDEIGVLKTTDQFAVLQHMQTNGANYGISTDSLVKIVQGFDSLYGLQLIGASFDWCEFEIKRKPADWLKFAKEVYAVCPDVVDQGTESVEALAEEQKRTNRLYFWWD